MIKPDIKKLVLLNLPYLFAFYFVDKVAAVFRMAPGTEMIDKLSGGFSNFGSAFANPLPSFHPIDLLVGVAGAACFKLAVYIKSKNRKKFRHGEEYGSARWGKPEDIKPYTDPVFSNNVILTQTEFLTMNSRPKQPKYARNKIYWSLAVLAAVKPVSLLSQTSCSFILPMWSLTRKELF